MIVPNTENKFKSSYWYHHNSWVDHLKKKKFIFKYLQIILNSQLVLTQLLNYKNKLKYTDEMTEL